MLDLSGVPVFDNHSHPLDPAKATLMPDLLAKEFYHGLGDLPEVGKGGRTWGASGELRSSFRYMGVVQTAICKLSRLLGCAPKLEAVADARNRLTAESFAGYTRLLYDDAGIVATVMDSGLPSDDPALLLTPGRILRLYQMSPALSKLVERCDSYGELVRDYQEGLEHAVKVDGFVGVKSHLAEEVGFGRGYVSSSEAEGALAAAKTGDAASYGTLYQAVFQATLLQCHDLGVPVHVHSGITGGPWNGPVANADPFLLMPLLRRPEFIQTRVVLLHGAFPWIQHAAMMAHALPHVWVDLGWTSPWVALREVECFRELIGIAPLSKVMVGSGGHGSPEISWLAAKVNKIALGEALADAVRLELLTEPQALQLGRMILHDNASRLYAIR